MERIPTGGWSAAIEAARAVIPDRVLDLIRPHYLCGTDPVFAGLHHYEGASFGRSYRQTAHVTYPFHQQHRPRASRHTTVVLPQIPRVETLVHELGHVLDERLGFAPVAEPVSWYAGTNRAEAFAEAFTSWLIPGYASPTDLRTVHLFDTLT